MLFFAADQGAGVFVLDLGDRWRLGGNAVYRVSRGAQSVEFTESIFDARYHPGLDAIRSVRLRGELDLDGLVFGPNPEQGAYSSRVFGKKASGHSPIARKREVGLAPGV